MCVCVCECRGCSKEEECKDSAGDVYDGTQVAVLGGTRITTQCCVAHKFDDDDAIAIDLGDICNTASSLHSSGRVSVYVVMCSVVMGLVMIWG